jgi:hypothetical protein
LILSYCSPVILGTATISCAVRSSCSSLSKLFGSTYGLVFSWSLLLWPIPTCRGNFDLTDFSLLMLSTNQVVRWEFTLTNRQKSLRSRDRRHLDLYPF